MAGRSVFHLWTLYMLWININCYSAAAAVTGQHQVIGSSQPVLVKEGDDVILPCHIDPPVNMEEQTVMWTRDDLKPDYVHLYQDGRYAYKYTHLSFKQRTTLFHEELSRGNISLKLSRARLSDNGTYECSATAKNNVPFQPSSSLIELIVAEDVIYIPPQGVLRLRPDTTSVTKPITSILWKHGPNKAAEWDLVLGPEVDYYGTFKNRTELDKETGQLVINNMTIEDGREYSVHINGRLLSKTYAVKQMKKVPKPVVIRLPCDSDSTNCEVHCYGDVTESGPVTYRWKKDEEEWMESDSGPKSNRLIVTKIEDGKVKTLTCEVKNEFSSERSDSKPNLLYEGPPPEPTPTRAIVGGVIGALFILAVLVLGVRYKYFRGDELKVLRSPMDQWTPKSLRWRLQLEKLANNKHDCEVIEVGGFVFVKNDEFLLKTGSNGTEVYLGLMDDGTEVSVKRITEQNYKYLKEYNNEFSHLLNLNNPLIVQYVGCAEDKNFGYLALELCEYDLEEYITDNKHSLSELEKKRLANQVLISLKVLHCQNPPILHRDIKPQNVLIDTDAKARLADFGIFLHAKRRAHTTGTGKQCWMSTEMVEEEERAYDQEDDAEDDDAEDDDAEDDAYTTSSDIQVAETKKDAEDDACTTSSDIQVAGMLIYYILSGGHHPFGEGRRCKNNIGDGKYNLDHVQDEGARDLIEKMINADPKRRPTVEECLAHPFWSTESEDAAHIADHHT